MVHAKKKKAKVALEGFKRQRDDCPKVYFESNMMPRMRKVQILANGLDRFMTEIDPTKIDEAFDTVSKIC